MFFGLNKKIIYSLFFFLLLVIGVFFMIFTNFYARNLEDNQNSIYIRNQYVVSLLYDNIRLQKTLLRMGEKYPEIAELIEQNNILSQKVGSAEKELTKEQQLNAELLKNYDKNKEAMTTGIRIVAISLLVIIMTIFLLLILLNYWVIQPIDKITNISKEVSSGVLSRRIKENHGRVLHDEFDMLFATYNLMLDSMEQSIESAKTREQFLQQLIDAMPDAIRVLDKEHNVIMDNKAFRQLLKTKGSCVGQKCYESYGFKKEGCPRSRYNCPIAHLSNLKEKSFRAIHEIGNIPIYLNAARLVNGRNQEDYYVIEAMHDLRSDIIFSHQQKISSLAFLSTSIAHEMKNNLGAIRMILEGILEEKSTNIAKPEIRKYLEMAHKQLVETVNIPERLLKMAQYAENEVTKIDTKDAIVDVMQMVDYSAKRAGIAVNLELKKDICIKGNEADFKMILLNLVQNAIKAMPDGGELRIESFGKRKKANIHITDNGTGISEEKLKHIFEPFYSGSEISKSSGLGLAIVSNLINKFQGKINVESHLGEGTKFMLEFPAVTKDE